MADELYADALAWSERQADLLRRLARGERVNDAVDWTNVIEEIEDVGLSEFRAVESLLGRAVEHLAKVHCWPSGPVDHWTAEARAFLIGARRAFTPSMRQRLDVPGLYDDARALVAGLTVDGLPPRPLPETCPLALDDLIVTDARLPDTADLLAKLAALP